MKRLFKNIGKFKTKITLQYESLTSDGAGGWSNTWVDDLTVWAHIEPLAGREGLEAEQLTGNQQFVFTIRYTNDFNVTPDNNYRIKYGSKLFNIHSVKVLDFENEYFEIIGWEL